MIRKKRVCVKCVTPIFDVIPNRPILGQINSIELTIDQIRKCITKKANVREILPDGQYKVLTLLNYDEFDEEPVPEAPVQDTVEPEIPEVVEETPEIVEETIVEESPEVEEITLEDVVENVEPEIPEVVEETPEIVEETVVEEEVPVVEEISAVVEETPEEAEPLAEIENTEEVVTEVSEYRPKNNNNKKKNKR